MRVVIVESPYSGNIELHLRYLRACMADCIARGEAPFASHGLYTQPGVLRDEVPGERAIGIAAGFAWREVAEATVVYIDLGFSTGMRHGISDAARMVDMFSECHEIEYRTLGAPWNTGSGVPNVGYALDESLGFATAKWGRE